MFSQIYRIGDFFSNAKRLISQAVKRPLSRLLYTKKFTCPSQFKIFFRKFKSIVT